jgi:hypothetical protein
VVFSRARESSASSWRSSSPRRFTPSGEKLSQTPAYANNGPKAMLINGYSSVPVLDTQGLWAVEGTGVSPDIEVVDRPDLVVAGHDPSLEKAVEVLMSELAKNPPKRLTVPPAPVIP